MNPYPIAVLLLTISLFGCSVEVNKATEERLIEVEKSDRESDGLVGPVMSVTELTYSAEEKFGEVVLGELTDRKHIRYNKHGSRTEQMQYSLGSLWMSSITDHNEDNQPIEVRKYGHGLKSAETITFNYDSVGNLIKETTYSSEGEPRYWSTMSYNRNRQLVESNHYSSNQDQPFKETYRYDKDGNQIEINRYSILDGKLASKVVMRYDPDGRMIDEILYDEGSINRKSSFKYDGQDNLIEETDYNHDGTVRSIRRFKYDGELVIENSLELVNTLDGDPIVKWPTKTIHHYDLMGNEVEVSRSYYGGTYLDTRRTTYEYEEPNDTYEGDSDGSGQGNGSSSMSKRNWVKRIDHGRDGTAHTVVIRQIEYFD